MKAVRSRISDARFMALLWKTIKAGHIDVGLFRAASEGVPQGGVISPLLSNIMLNELDQYLHKRYLSGKARNFAASLTALLSGNYSESKVDMAEHLNRKLKGGLRSTSSLILRPKSSVILTVSCSGSWLTGWPVNTVRESLP